MKLRKLVDEGGPLPRGYGISYINWGSMQAVCYPVGLNLLVSLARMVYVAMRHGFCAMHTDCRSAYSQGYSDGLLRAATKLAKKRERRNSRG